VIYARLRLRDPLPLHAGDRVILRDPGAAGLAIYGATVLDPFPPPLARRGAGAAAVRELGGWPDAPRAADLLRRHKLLRAAQLTAAGVAGLPEPVARDWLADPEHWAWLRAELPKAVAAFCARDPLAQGMPAEAARAALGLPSRDLVPALVGGDVLLDGAYLRIFSKHAPQEPETPPAGATRQEDGATAPAPGNPVGAAGPAPGKSSAGAAGPTTARSPAAGQLPPRIADAVQAVLDGLAADPFAAPDTERLRQLGLDARALAAAARVGLLLRVADLVVRPVEQSRQRQLAFTADASHELRTPLSVIEAESALALSKDRDAASYRATVERIAEESARLRHIVDSLLWLARFDAAPLPEDRAPVDVGVVLAAAGERFRAVAQSRSLHLHVDAQSDPAPIVVAPPDWIDRVCGVLLANACQYTPPGGSVNARVNTLDGSVRLTVDDSGPGIPADQRERIFDRFHRAVDAEGGAGLGLAIGDAVVRATRGRWEVGESPQGGASMMVSWPRASAMAAG
jgi:signal transduction histidine kinase